MDMKTGQTFSTKEQALAAGVSEADLAFITGVDADKPETWELVKFSSGPFKNRTYRRGPRGQLVRVREER
jgi:hypothetical protein